MLDTDTLDPTSIVEIVQTTRYLLATVAGDTPFDIIYCVPHLELIFFEAGLDLKRIFPNYNSVFMLQFAKTQPKNQLELLFANGGGPRNLRDFLGSLTTEDVGKLRSVYPIQHLVVFISNNLEPAVHGRGSA